MQQDISDYIKRSRDYGFKDAEIRAKLLSAGWYENDIDLAFNKLDSKPQPPVALPLRPSAPPPLEALRVQKSPGLLKRSPLKILVPAALLIIIVISGYFYAASQGYLIGGFIIATPQKIWSEFINQKQSQIYKTTYKLSYVDKGNPGTPPTSQSLSGLGLKDINLSVNGTSYINTVDEKNPEAQSKILYTFGSGNSNFSTGIEYRVLGKNVYINFGDNPFLANILGLWQGSQKTDWLSLSLDPAKYPSSPGDAQVIKKLSDQNYVDQLSQALDAKQYVKLQQYVGREKINNIVTSHYKASLDKSGLKTAISKSFSALTELSGQPMSTQDQEDLDTSLNALVDKLQISSFELWVGAKDFQIYRIHFASNAPSVLGSLLGISSGASATTNSPSSDSLPRTDQIKQAISKIDFSAQLTFDADYSDYGKLASVETPSDSTDLLQLLQGAQSTSRDSSRMADIRELQSKLELYFNDHSRYPNTLSDLVPTYLPQVLVAPEPADGACSEDANTYKYTPASGGQNYSLNFCFGEATGGYSAGSHVVSASGIQ